MHLYQERKREKAVQNPNSERDSSVPAEDERNYGTERLNLGKNANESEDESKSENESKHKDNLVIESK